MNRLFLVLGFVLIMALYSDASPKGIPNPEDCCFTFFNGNIPSKNILNVKKTGSHCPEQGFIITTARFPGLCVRDVAIIEQDES
ncbi:C-C motif chemokine 4 homolog [Tachysurus fulvidraco]|uniref:C-C motif chemokine 4 homolog n=1 Tax=Tachysurus fulvidraco TaxID=1234273 RepID=UPI001FEE5743|nr:C-C motif chemokine 4 homolog [Tachysurus fulvidraco]